MSKTLTTLARQVSSYSASLDCVPYSIIKFLDIIFFNFCQVGEAILHKTIQEPKRSLGPVRHDGRSLHLNCSFCMVEMNCDFTKIVLSNVSHLYMKDTVEFYSVTIFIVIDMVAVDGDIIDI